MIIELYGLPATGKTTAAKKMATEEGWVIVGIKSRAELLYYNLLFKIKHPVKFLGLFCYLLRLNPFWRWRLFYLKFMNTFLGHNAKYMKARKHEKAIIDQGHWQNIISVPERKLSEHELVRYTKYFMRPDKLLVFYEDKETRTARMGERGYGARERFGEEYVKNWEEVTEYNDELLRRSLDNLGVKYSNYIDTHARK